jgi:DNA-binding response OmpR family regulator
VFTIEIPVSKNVYSEEELSEEEEYTPVDLPEMSEIVISGDDADAEEDIEKLEYSTVLIVEDNKDLQELIVNNFSNRYNVLRADNGVKALEVLRENEVDLIISDVMMPEMDGLTFCKMVKNDIATSHINVLMLTAKNSTEDRIDCYNAGADAYIAKPFELSVLNARAKNLIRKRQQKTETF